MCVGVVGLGNIGGAIAANLLADGHAVAVVGSRRASPGALETARRLASGLAGVGLTIVSGLARGCDAAAHRGALDAGGRTVAVLGSGLDVIYPPEHGGLADDIAGHARARAHRARSHRPLQRRLLLLQSGRSADEGVHSARQIDVDG